MDYLQAVTRKELTVTLGGTARTVRTASVRQFFLLQTVYREPEEEHIPRYLAIALDIDVVETLYWDALETYDAYQQLVALNTPQPLHVDYARSSESGDGSRGNGRVGGSSAHDYEYSGRALANLVTRIAGAFGWSRDTILDDLTYDEARCYLQEIALKEHADREFIYSLSEVAYDAKGHIQKFPELPIPKTIPGARPEHGSIDERIVQIAQRRRSSGAVAGVIIDSEQSG